MLNLPNPTQINGSLVLSITFLLVLGCEEEPPDTVISQFDRPQDVALVCFDHEQRKTLPLECCKKRETISAESCGSNFAVGKLYAFVTQTTPGEVAVVDIEEQIIVDQDQRIPYNSFIPVGGQPNDIVAANNGRRVYTANYETGDISVISVVDEKTGHSVIDRPFLTPADSIDMGGAVARMVMVSAPEQFRDRFVFVTQPTLGRLAVVALDSNDCPDPTASPVGCFLAYLQLSPVRQDTGEAESHPWAITSSDGQSVYVGSYDGEVIWDIQSEALIFAALSVPSPPAEIDSENVLNDTISIDPYRIRTLSLEPNRGRWIYAIEEEKGGVIAINLDSREPNSDEPPEIIEVKVPGRTRAVTLVELEEQGEPGPFTFNGTFAVVSTTTAGIAVIDVDDANADPLYPYLHEIRSAVDLSADGGTPSIDDEFQLTIDGEKVESSDIGSYLYFDTETNDQDAGCDAGAEYRRKYDDGIKLRCDPRESRAEKWVLTWQGLVGISGVGTITNIQDPQGGPWKLLSEDAERDFCALELYTPGSREGYPGDLLVITSAPTPNKGYEKFCKEQYNAETDELAFRVVGVSRYYPDDEESPPNVIEFVSEETQPAKILSECFGQALSYEIRSDRHWILKGAASSYRRIKGEFDQSKRACVYKDESPSKMRVYPGEKIDNGMLAFKMRYGETWMDAGPEHLIESGSKKEPPTKDPQVTLGFEITGGYMEMFRVVPGNNITEILFTPDDELLLVDQAGEGLIMFDMLETFSTIGTPVN